MKRTIHGMVIAIGVAACHPTMGGTPGPSAVRCVPATASCGEVNRTLEGARENVGGWCGTPYMDAAARLATMGPAIAPYLARALSDRDVEIADVAAMALVRMGEGARLTGWCGRHPKHANARALCRDVDR